jgi:hypothetical protein
MKRGCAGEPAADYRHALRKRPGCAYGPVHGCLCFAREFVAARKYVNGACCSRRSLDNRLFVLIKSEFAVVFLAEMQVGKK